MLLICSDSECLGSAVCNGPASVAPHVLQINQRTGRISEDEGRDRPVRGGRVRRSTKQGWQCATAERRRPSAADLIDRDRSPAKFPTILP